MTPAVRSITPAVRSMTKFTMALTALLFLSGCTSCWQAIGESCLPPGGMIEPAKPPAPSRLCDDHDRDMSPAERRAFMRRCMKGKSY
uniref:Lipoprotein n=1 Tax=Magnetococcus massalia (strain MO-1) TaxID=451514 RepID=A0A1S7LQG2_MAGMO|nr:exported protein of unknown function [Candidatus Magnetococcus massalia]